MPLTVYILIMGVLQGLTEFLPVSSSGHLAVLGAFFGFEESESLQIGIVLHAGSLLAILAYYRKRIWNFLRLKDLRSVGLILLGSIPAGAAGVLLKKSGLMEKLFGGSMVTMALAFWITGAVLLLTSRKGLTVKADSGDASGMENMSSIQALIIGLAQMVAILPGISRSGSTISAGILCGVKRQAAAEFSFMLALVAIGGATLLEMLDMIKGGGEATAVPVPVLAAGFAVSAVVSTGALCFLNRIVKGGKLHYFSYYLFLLGAALLATGFFR